jgi:3-oxoacyl-[acyl-carrier protein] reductase
VVVVSDIDEAPAAQVAKEIEATGNKAVACSADVTKPEDAERLMDTAVEKLGDLNILVNNAGLIRDNFIPRMTDQQWKLVIDINLTGTFNCIRAASKYFMVRKDHIGRIVNTSSVAGAFGNIGQINYSAAKAGIIGLTKTVAKEWQRYGVNCNAVAFGLVDTRLTQEKENSDEVLGEKVGIPKRIRDKMVDEAAGQIMQPEDAARSVLFLASDDAAFITGQTINVSAGLFI